MSSQYCGASAIIVDSKFVESTAPEEVKALHKP